MLIWRRSMDTKISKRNAKNTVEEEEDEVDDGIHMYIIYVCAYLHVPSTPVCI